jgi:hypothetical protein
MASSSLKNFDGFAGFANSSLCNIGGMFISWLLEQQDRDDTAGFLARTMFDDYNAGCASLYPDAARWKEHFESKHKKHAAFLMELLGDALVEYAQLTE